MMRFWIGLFSITAYNISEAQYLTMYHNKLDFVQTSTNPDLEGQHTLLSI